MLYANIIWVFQLIQLTKAKCLFRLQKITEQQKKCKLKSERVKNLKSSKKYSTLLKVLNKNSF